MTDFVYVSRWALSRGVVKVPVDRLRDSAAGPGCKYDPIERTVLWASEIFIDPLSAMQAVAAARAQRVVVLEQEIADLKKPFGMVEARER